MPSVPSSPSYREMSLLRSNLKQAEYHLHKARLLMRELEVDQVATTLQADLEKVEENLRGKAASISLAMHRSLMSEV